ncbi:SDR family oxidoreductase [Streptomyces stramineus]
MTTPASTSNSRPPSSRVAVVTGAGRGIGRAIAQELASAGHHLVLCDKDGAPLIEVADTLGPGHRYVTADVTDPETSQRLAADALRHYGRLDVWINNAGILPTGPLRQHPRHLVDHTIAVNLTAVCDGSQAALSIMLEQGSGHLINIASASALKPVAGMATYSATKAGVLALSEALRREARPYGVHVSTVLPCLIATRLASGLQLPFNRTPCRPPPSPTQSCNCSTTQPHTATSPAGSDG